MTDREQVFEGSSIEEKRELLRLSRIHFDIDTKYPREKATDSIVERGIFGCSSGQPCSEEEINNTIASLGLMNGLRKNELKASLERLCQDYRIQNIDGKFLLNKERVSNLEFEIQEANRRFEIIVNRVYNSIIDKRNKQILTKFFLEFISMVFAKFGEQWIKSLCNQAEPKDFLKGSDIETIFTKLAKKHALPKSDRENIRKLSLKFFIENDPDYGYLKFNLAQSFYITKILGIDIPINLFSQEIFSNSVIFLDTNIVFASLLPVSRHNITFKELLRICKKINIELNVSTITKNEVDRVVFYFEKEAANLFDEIPEKIAPKVRGTFFETYTEEKKKDPKFCVSDLFKPFHELKETLKNTFSIDIIDDVGFDKLFQNAEKNTKLQNIFNSKSLEIRKRSKSKDSLSHDIFHYFLVEKTRQSDVKKSWFLTIDTSLPHVAASLQKNGDIPFCFTLDVLMQCFSPFITTEQEVYDFAEVFSKLIANQLFPSSKLFDVRDFVFFNDIGVKMRELSEDDIEEALNHIKRHVLKGRAYSRADFEKVAYEVKKLFSGRADKDETIRRQVDRISEMERKHKTELSSKDEEIKRVKKEKDRIEEEIKIREMKRVWYIKITCFCITALSILSILIYLTNSFAEGTNLLRKIINFWPYYGLWVAIFSIYLRWINKNDLFRKFIKKKVII